MTQPSLRDPSGAPPKAALPPAAEWAILLASVVAFITVLKLITQWIPFATDWELFFRPVTLGWTDGSLLLYQETSSFWNPPWLLWPLIPLAFWPAWMGWGILVVATMFVMLWLTRKYKAWWLVFLSPLIIDPIHNGQVDVIPMLGIALAWLATDRPLLMGIALTLMITKPQACFLVALWLWMHHPKRMRALVVPIGVFAASVIVDGWDWPLRWASGSSAFRLVQITHNASPWHSLGLWMIPVALVLGIWALRLPSTRRNLGAVVNANALIAPYLGSHSLIQVLAFGLLQLGPAWAAAGWIASLTPLLRALFGRGTERLDFAVAAILMIGYLLHANHRSVTRESPD
jgi:hypothetical protein